MEASRWEILTEGKAGCFSDGAAMPSKSLIQFSVDRWDCVLSLLFDLRPNYGGGNEDISDFLQKVPCPYCCINAAAGHHLPTPLLETPGHSQTSLGQSLVCHCSFLLGPGVYKFLFVPSKRLVSQSCVSSGSPIVG